VAVVKMVVMVQIVQRVQTVLVVLVVPMMVIYFSHWQKYTHTHTTRAAASGRRR